MPKIRDLGINVIPDTMRPPEIDGTMRYTGTWTSASTCTPGTLIATGALVFTNEDIELLKQRLRQ